MTAAAIRATFAEIQMVKSRDVLVLKFEVPLERADEALKNLGGVPRPGEERWFGIARLVPAAAEPSETDGEGEEDRASNNSPANDGLSEAEKAEMRKAVKLAGILPKRDDFIDWLIRERNHRNPTEEGAADYIRCFCGVLSRSEIATNKEAFERFKRIDTSYRLWKDGFDPR